MNIFVGFRYPRIRKGFTLCCREEYSTKGQEETKLAFGYLAFVKRVNQERSQ